MGKNHLVDQSPTPSTSSTTPSTPKTPESGTGVFFSPQHAEGRPTGEADGHGAADRSDARDHGAPADRTELSGLAPLFERAELWRGVSLSGTAASVCATGYPRLDAVLPGGGWPVTGLTELMSGAPGVGELRLLMPALSALARQKPGWVVWIAPPYLPNAPALQQWGLPPERVLLIHPRTANDAAWAAEQALTSGTCLAMLLWTDTLESGRAFAPARGRRAAPLSMQQFSRRLQLAAASHQCWALMLRAASARRQPSAAMLRLYIEACEGRRDLHVVKVRGGRPAVIAGFDEGVDVGAAMARDVLSPGGIPADDGVV